MTGIWIFFKEVPLLNTEIITQGSEGQEFFIIEEGMCKAIKKQPGQQDRELDLKAGDYFGELALLNNEPRAASVFAESDKVLLLALDRKAFNRLLGPLKEMMAEAQNRYS